MAKVDNHLDFYSAVWFDLCWSRWKPLNKHSFSDLPQEPGIYRIRHRSPDREFIEYIGETSDTRRRIQSLARGVYAAEMPYRDPHTAAPCLWAVRDRYGAELEVSHVSPPKAKDDRHRKGIECALIALHRRAKDRSPTANFGRIIDGYKQSTYSKHITDNPYLGGKLKEGENEPNSQPGIGALDWENPEELTARNWMGLDWSEEHRFGDRLDADPPEVGLYRIWYDGEVPPLAYIGQSSNIPTRLYGHEKIFGEDAKFSIVSGDDLDARHKREEAETDLIGAHFTACEASPLAQFGHKENLPPTVRKI